MILSLRKQFDLWLRRTTKDRAESGRADDRNEDRFEVASAIRVANDPEGLMILDGGNGILLRCNRTGAQVWNGISAGQSVTEIAGVLAREYGLPAPLAISHVQGFVRNSMRCGLVVARRETPC